MFLYFLIQLIIKSLDMNKLDIKKIRALTGLTQEKFAKIFDVTRGTVAVWEKGVSIPKLSIALKLKKIEKRFENGETNFIYEYFNDDKTDSVLNESELTYQSEGKIILDTNYPKKNVTIIPLKGRGGLENSFYDRLYFKKLEKEQLVIKETSSEGSEWFKIEIEGISMDDSTSDFEGSKYSLAEGDWAYCRSISKSHWRNKLHINSVRVFCFFHNTRGIIFKKIKSHNVENGELVLTSLNKDKKQFPDFTINVAECSYILNVIKVLSDF